MLTEQAQLMRPVRSSADDDLQFMNASSVTKPVGTAFMTAGGWTMEDSIVASADFARQYRVQERTVMRDLIVETRFRHARQGRHLAHC